MRFSQNKAQDIYFFQLIHVLTDQATPLILPEVLLQGYLANGGSEMKKTTDPSFWFLLVFSVGPGIWAETFGKQSDWFYLTKFGLPFMLA